MQKRLQSQLWTQRDLGEYVSCQFTYEVYSDIFYKYLNIDFDGFPVREIQLNKYEKVDSSHPTKIYNIHFIQL